MEDSDDIVDHDLALMQNSDVRIYELQDEHNALRIILVPTVS